MIQALAPAPTRGTNTITLAAKMVTIQLSVLTGTESTRVDRKEFLGGDVNVPCGRNYIRKDTGDTIDQAAIVKMALAGNGNWVPLDDDEIAACTTPRGMAEVITFVPVKDFANYLPENVAQVRVKKDSKRPNPAAEKAFAMLLAGMRARKVGALIKVAMRGPARYAILTSDADLILIFPADGVRQPAPMPQVTLTKAEVEMAGSLIDVIGTSTPVLTDDTAEAVQEYVDSKASGLTPVPQVPVAPINDLMAAFEASIAAAQAAKVQVA